MKTHIGHIGMSQSSNLRQNPILSLSQFLHDPL